MLKIETSQMYYVFKNGKNAIFPVLFQELFHFFCIIFWFLVILYVNPKWGGKMFLKVNTLIWFKIKRIVICIAFIINSMNLMAEGTKEIQPTASSHGRLQIMPFVTDFAMFDAAPEHRLHISICNPGELIYYGFGHIRDYFGAVQTDVVYRIKDPNGNTVVGPSSVPSSGAGFINNYTEAVNGPDVVNPAGYNALSYTPLTTGDYYIEFNFSQPHGYDRKIFDYIDITVVDPPNTVKTGRLWSKNWQLTTNPPPTGVSPYQAGYDGIMYIYADDGIVTSVDLNDMQPFVFNITANETGCFNTGNPLQDRKSTDGNHTYPQYRIFLNDPDSICFPTGYLGDFTAPTTITGCPGSFCVNVHVDKAGNVEILLDLNGIPGYQSNTEDVILAAQVTVGHNCIHWDGLDGLGNPVASGTQIPIEVNYFNGLTHLPIYDVEGNVNGFIVEIVRPQTPNPTPALFWDDTDIPGGTAELGGCTNPSGCHTWPIGNCLNSPVPPYCSLGDMRTINTWWYAHAIADMATVNFELPLVNANANTPPGQNDTLICAENDSLQLNGLIQFAPGGKWTGGGGSFHPSDSSLHAVYFFSQAEIDNGYTTLVLTSVDADCPDISDTIHVTIAQANLTLSPDATICQGESVTLTASGGQTYFWSPASTLDDHLLASPLATPQNSTTYTVSITDDNGCTASGQIAVTVNPLPDVDFAADTLEGCAPLDVNFSSFTSSNVALFEWNFGNSAAGNQNFSNQENPSHTFNNAGLYTVSLTVTSDLACENNTTYNNYIKVYPSPQASFYTVPREGNTENMLFNFFNTSTSGHEWLWDFGDPYAGVLNYSTLKDPQHEYSAVGTYEVWLKTVSLNGCEDSTFKKIIIRDDHTFYVPSAFTPNGDGLNDIFIPVGTYLDEEAFRMYIFNRWGEIVFETKDVRKGWDGTIRNTDKKAPQDVYTWLIYLENDFYGTRRYTGHVTLIR